MTVVVGSPGRPAAPSEVVERVRERLARGGSTLTPALVAQTLRDEGRPVGDATVLAVLDALRQDVLGAGDRKSVV